MPKNAAENFDKLPEEKIEPEKDIKKDSRNHLILAMNYLENKYKFRYNLFTARPEYAVVNGKVHDYNHLNERDFDNIHNEVKITGKVRVGRDDFKSLVSSKFISQDYDPIADYLGSLKKWDGEDRIRLFLQQVQLQDESHRELLIKYFTKWFTTLVGSLVDNRCYNEYCFVFTGEQGRGKTRFFHSLVPLPLRLQYTFTGNFNPRDKDHEEMLGTKIIINLDEMGTMNRTDEETLKTTMSKRYVTLRRAYGRAPIHLYRKASFCGSHNREEFLTDLSGNRRWLPFAIHNIDIDKGFDIGLLYSQAMAMYKDGFNIYMDRTEIAELEAHNEQFRYISMEEQMVISNYRVPSDQESANDIGIRYMDTTDIVHSLASMEKYKKMNVNDTVLKRFGQALKRVGFERVTKVIPNKKPYPIKVWKVVPITENQAADLKSGRLNSFDTRDLI